MSFFVHYIATLIYAAAGLAVAFALPRHVPGIDHGLSYAFGGLTVLVLLLVHVVFLLGGVRRRLADEVAGLRSAQDETMTELGNARTEARQIYETIESLESRRKSGPKGKGTMRDFDDVVAEVRVLQSLIEQLSASPSANLPSVAPAVAAAPAVAKAVVEAPLAVAAPAAEDPAAGPSPHRILPPVAEGLDDAAILNIVREGLKCDRVDLVLQPIVSLPQRKHKYYECFSRIHDGAGKMVVPDQYLHIARDSGLIAPIDNMLLFRCVQIVRRVQRAQHNVGFFCNISAHSLSDTPFLRDFISFMAENMDLAPNLIFEFGQSDLAGMNEEIAYNLHRLGGLGFRFSMDRLTGLHMDYAELSRHRFRFLKVTADVLLRHMRGEEEDIDIRYFKDMLDRLGIDLIVEKIEDEPTLLEFLEFGIDFGQGYLFGAPRLARTG